MIKDLGEELFVGENPYHIESIFQKGYAYGYSHHPDFARMGILSAIEMACWDIVGKDLNKPVYVFSAGLSATKFVRTPTSETPVCRSRAKRFSGITQKSGPSAQSTWIEGSRV